MIIDAHQHFWDVSRTDYEWLTPSQGALYRSYLPTDLMPILRRNGVSATLLMQAAPSEAETCYLFDERFAKGALYDVLARNAMRVYGLKVAGA